MTTRTVQVRTAYWLWRGGMMERETALGLIRWIRRSSHDH